MIYRIARVNKDGTREFLTRSHCSGHPADPYVWTHDVNDPRIKTYGTLYGVQKAAFKQRGLNDVIRVIDIDGVIREQY